jgi:hypothetical protein
VGAFAAWHDFFIAQVGASAALSGLLFVALSINIERILKFAWLPSRAVTTLSLLLGALIEASISLWPRESLRVLGLELLFVGVAVWLLVLHQTFWGPKTPADYRSGAAISAVVSQLTALSVIAGALAVVFGEPAGIYVIAAGMLLAIVGGFYNSWVLLVEILR